MALRRRVKAVPLPVVSRDNYLTAAVAASAAATRRPSGLGLEPARGAVPWRSMCNAMERP
jgi:hypothetical protein